MTDFRKDLSYIIKNCDMVFLSTLNLNGIPESRALSNEFNKGELNDKLELYFTTHSNSPKCEQIKKNSKASLYYYMAKDMQNMSLFGTIEIANDKALREKLWKDEFKNFYPKGKDDELYCVLKFTTESYKYYAVINNEYKRIEGKL